MRLFPADIGKAVTMEALRRVNPNLSGASLIVRATFWEPKLREAANIMAEFEETANRVNAMLEELEA